MSTALARSNAAAEPRLIEGLGNIARALKLPPATDPRKLRGWIKNGGLPAWRVKGRGPYYADPDQLEAWWRAAQTSATAGDCR